MAFFLPLLASAAAGSAATAQADASKIGSPQVMVSHREVDAAELSRFVVNRNYVPLEGGNILLRLYEKPVLEVNSTRMECELLGWNIKLPTSRVDEVPQQMARTFTWLLAKADRNELTQEEKQTWMSILDRVDYTSFCIDRAAPQYVEGTLRRTTPECYVDWSDGRAERIVPNVSVVLSEIRPGEMFGAYVKLGHNNKALNIERVTFLAAE